MTYSEVRPKTYSLLFHCPCCEGCMKILKKIKGVEAPLEVDVYANKVTISVTGDIQTIISELKRKKAMFSKILPDEQNQHENEPSELQIVPVKNPVQKATYQQTGSGVIAKLIDKKASSQLQHSMTPKHGSSQLQLVPVKNLQKAMYQQTGSIEVTERPPRSIAEKQYERHSMPHQHVWELKNYHKRFLCDICCEDGYGPRHRWNGHNPYEIHVECKNPKITVTHELFSGSTFELRNRLKHADPCIACGKSVCGRFYHCKESKLNLHPLCANLKVKKYLSGYCFVLRMELSNNCLRCMKKEVDGGKSWSYESREDASCCLHVHCIIEMVQEATKRSGDWYEDAVSLTSTSVNVRNTDVSKNRNKGKYDYIIVIASILLEAVIPMLVGGPAALLVVAVGRLLKVIIMKGYSHWRKQLRQEVVVPMLVEGPVFMLVGN